MTISMLEDVQPFDVLLARVWFEDVPGVYKVRPVVALGSASGRLSVSAVKVTSHAPREECAGEVFLADWRSEGLAKPTVARCSQVFEIELSDVFRRMGSLSSRDCAALLAGLMEAGAM